MNRRKVLIPLDGSDFSLRILKTVREFFDPEEVNIILFRAANPPSLSADKFAADISATALPVGGAYEVYSRALDTSYADTVKERETYRTELVLELRQVAEQLERAGFQVSVEVVFGEPSQRIIDYAADKEIDLVAMTTHGRTGLSRALMGSVAERVLRGVSIPVMLIRSTEQTAEHAQSAEALTDLQA